MKELLVQYADYNRWANKRLCNLICSLTEAQQVETINSSFPSLKKTLLHMWDASSVWWQRIQLSEHVIWPGTVKDYSAAEVSTELLKQDDKWSEFVNGASPASLAHVFAYQNSKKEQFKQPVFEVLMHLFDHNTYHRGQIVTMMHQIGVTKIPPTDFIVFVREK